MTKYVVVANIWDEERQLVCEKGIGEFFNFHLAEMFRKAYNKEFSANARICEFDF